MSRYTRFFSNRALGRSPSPIRALQPLTTLPGMIALSGGVPNPSLFPITELSFKINGSESPVTLSDSSLKQALQYSNSYGLPDLIQQWKDILQREHPQNPYQSSSQQLSVMVTTGSQDGLAKCFDMLLNPGDPIIVENPTYCGALSALYPLSPELLPVETDHHGLMPEDLLKLLKDRDPSKPKPKAIYTIPTGQNPSGSTIPLDRRHEIYSIACEHDLLILEDDPYWFLHYREQEQPQSFFSLDSEKRVIRFDSLSKVVSSGLRIGFVSGPNELIEKMQLDQQVSVLHACGVSQAITSELLSQWKEEGFNDHVQKVRDFYKEKRDICHKLASKYLSDLAEWSMPTAGMFMWFKCNGIDDTKTMIETKAREENVLLVPGQAFRPDNNPSPHVRASFSITPEDKLEEGFSRLRKVLLSSKQ